VIQIRYKATCSALTILQSEYNEEDEKSKSGWCPPHSVVSSQSQATQMRMMPAL